MPLFAFVFFDCAFSRCYILDVKKFCYNYKLILESRFIIFMIT